MRTTGVFAALLMALMVGCGEKGVGAEQEETESPPASGASISASPASLVVDGTGLQERAKVTDEAARATALAGFPGASIVAAELEEDGGALIYSYDVQVPGKEGIEEVHVDALTGQQLSVEHENPADEKEEADEPAGAGR